MLKGVRHACAKFTCAAALHAPCVERICFGREDRRTSVTYITPLRATAVSLPQAMTNQCTQDIKLEHSDTVLGLTLVTF